MSTSRSPSRTISRFSRAARRGPADAASGRSSPRLVGQIGRPLDEPALAGVQLVLSDGTTLREVESEAGGIVTAHIAGVGDLAARLAREGITPGVRADRAA